MSGPEARGRYGLLDGLRGVAAVVVLVYHVAQAEQLPELFKHAYLAVDFFFLLSGFVIGAAYEDRLRAGWSVGAYLRTRLIRFYPVIALGVVVGLLAWTIRPHDADAGQLGGRFALEALLVPSGLVFVQLQMFFFNPPQWSLFYELIVNALHAVFVRVLTFAVLVATVIASGAALVGIGIAYEGVDVGWARDNALPGVVRAVFPFAVGLLLHRLHNAGRLPSLRPPFWIPALMLATVAVAPEPAIPHASAVLDLAVVLLVYPLLLVLALGARTPARVEPALHWLGFISYPLYALHGSIVWAATPFIAYGDLSRPVQLLCWLGIAAGSMLLAWAVGRFYDEPTRRWLTARLGGRRVAERPSLSPVD